MARIRFYRGSQETSLPAATQDGAIYIVQTETNVGEIYADLNNQRVKVGTGSEPSSAREIAVSPTEPTDDSVKIWIKI